MLCIHIGRWSHLALYPVICHNAGICLAHETLPEYLNAVICEYQSAWERSIRYNVTYLSELL